MAEQFRIGPSVIWYGDPTSAGGLKFIGKTRGDVTVEPNIEIAMGQVDQVGMTPLAGSIYFAGLAPVVTVPLVDEEKAKIAEYLKGSSIMTAGGKDALVFGAGINKIAEADIGTLYLQPVDEIDQGTNGIDAPSGVWLPAAICNQFGQLTFNRPEGDDTLQPHEVQFAGLYRTTDHSAANIPQAARVMFQGSPEAVGLVWQVPDPAPYV